jgi:hypothetical protein
LRSPQIWGQPFIVSGISVSLAEIGKQTNVRIFWNFPKKSAKVPSSMSWPTSRLWSDLFAGNSFITDEIGDGNPLHRPPQVPRARYGRVDAFTPAQHVDVRSMDAQCRRGFSNRDAAITQHPDNFVGIIAWRAPQ